MEPSVTNLILPYESRTASCTNYVHEGKNGDNIRLGNAKGDIILVGFAADLSLENKESVLAKYPFYERMDGEVSMDSGLITKVVLKPEATCFEAEKIIKDLQKQTGVFFALPTFLPSPEQQGTYAWVGLSNEIIVSLEEGTPLDKFEAALAATGAQVVFSLTDEIHVVSVDKTSSGNALAVAKQFNALDFVATAEPNLIYTMAPNLIESSGTVNSLMILKEKN
jgi:hypothetical protein